MRKQFRLAELAKITASTLVGDPEQVISSISTLELAESEDATFLANPRYQEWLAKTRAGVICIGKETPPQQEKNFLVSDDPSRTFQQIVELLTEKIETAFVGIHPTAIVHPSCKLGKDLQIGPYVVIDKECEIGDRTRLSPFVSIGPRVKIGTDCLIHPHVVIRENCTVGSRVIIQPAAVIGSCGFGYTTDSKGHHQKLEQLGDVIVEDDVEIGACTTIDRARFKTTRIGSGTKIDNLVQIGHNVTLGPHNIIVAQTGIAGSSKTGSHVIFGGQAGVVGHVEICDNVMVATRGGVSKSIHESGKYAGGPVMPLADYNRQQVLLRKIEEYVKKIDELEARLAVLEKNSK